MVGLSAPTLQAGSPEPDAPEGEDLQRPAAPWWVLHTRSRNEKVVADRLTQEGVACYLPFVRIPRLRGGRRVDLRIPLFPGYLFLSGGPHECDLARKTNRVANVLRVRDQVQFRSELRHIRLVVESGAPVDLYPGLQEGRRCRVFAGSLAGLEGVVLRRRNPSRMYIAATVLSQSAVIEIDCALLEPLD